VRYAADFVMGFQSETCTAPDLLDTERDSNMIVSGFALCRQAALWGDTEVAAPLIKSQLRAATALAFSSEPPQHGHATRARASARACAGVRCPRRSMSHSVLYRAMNSPMSRRASSRLANWCR
jgi:hypothetical protein